MNHYLWILKTTHGGADMDTCLEMAKGGLDGDLQWQIYDMLRNRNEWWVPGKLVEIRQRLEPYWRVSGLFMLRGLSAAEYTAIGTLIVDSYRSVTCCTA